MKTYRIGLIWQHPTSFRTTDYKLKIPNILANMQNANSVYYDEEEKEKKK